MRIYMKYISRLVLIIWLFAIGAGAGWIYERGGYILSAGQYAITEPPLLPAGNDMAREADSPDAANDADSVYQKSAIALVIDDFGYERTETVDGFLMFPVKIACAGL